MQLSPANTLTRFINLDESVERRAHVEEALKVVEPVIGSALRFPAIRHSPGWKGCTLSHLAVLKEAIDTAPPNIQHLAVFEDDILWRPKLDIAGILAKPIHTAFDMLILAYPPWFPDLQHWVDLPKDPQLMRLKGGDLAWTTGYIVHRRFWSTLYRQWTKTLDTLQVDVSWRQLLARHTFLCYTPVLGNQSQLASDVDPTRRTHYRHLDPNIALVGEQSNFPINRLFPLLRSIDKSFDFNIKTNNSRFVSPSVIWNAVQLCKRRWVHNGKRCCYDFTNPNCLCDCQVWP